LKLAIDFPRPFKVIATRFSSFTGALIDVRAFARFFTFVK
jgi:hypothetical protein